MNVKCFDTVAASGKNIIVYVCSRFARDTPLEASKRRWAVLSRSCVEILVKHVSRKCRLLGVRKEWNIVAGF